MKFGLQLIKSHKRAGSHLLVFDLRDAAYARHVLHLDEGPLAIVYFNRVRNLILTMVGTDSDCELMDSLRKYGMVLFDESVNINMLLLAGVLFDFIKQLLCH